MRNCTICGKVITLSPSAAERSRKTGKPASYFTALFTYHADCLLIKRKEEASELMSRLRAEALIDKRSRKVLSTSEKSDET